MLATALPKPQPAADRYRSPKPLTWTLGKAQRLQPDKRGPRMCRAAQDRASLEPVCQLVPSLLRVGWGGSDVDMFCVCV